MAEVTHSGNSIAGRRRRWLLIIGIPGAVLVAALAVLASIANDLIAHRLRGATIDLLRSRFDSEVELGHLTVQLRPAMRVRYEDLVLRHRGRRDIPPIVAIRALTLEAGWWELWNRRINRVHIEGLEIVIPPRRGEDMPDIGRKNDRAPGPSGATSDGRPDVLIRELVSEDARLSIMPKREGKRTREFLLHAIRFEQLQFAKATPFEASLTNPVPEGRIETSGTFGPWNGEEPILTPVNGTFTFDADLGTIKGIGGMLDSEGSFSGPLERIGTRGRTETPDFRITALQGNALPLSTTYDAVVDGTDGDVILNEVHAKLAQSRFLTKGAIVGVKGMKGRHIMLDVKAERARLEDVLRLSLKGPNPPMTGRLSLQAKLDLPPKSVDADVIDRMTLDGVFHIDEARFTSGQVQEKIDELARRGSGRPKDPTIDDVMSDMRGRIRLANGGIRISNLTFAVQGATIAMDGVYNLHTEALDFRGVVLLRARASQTMTGFKSLLLKPFDLLLRKQGAGTRLAIKVTGTRNDPQFGVDVGRTLKGQ
jgi:hypothetical protein